MKNRLSMLCALVALVLGVCLTPGHAQTPGEPIFDYEWIKGHPYKTDEHEAVLRITMHGEMDTTTSPGLVVSGFNFALEIPSGVVNENLVPYSAGGGSRYELIVPQTPKDSNAYDDNGTLVRQLADYRDIIDAYPASSYPTAPNEGRDEVNTMRWDDDNFIVEPIAGAPSGKQWVVITGVADRLIEKEPLGDILSRTNDLTSAAATEPLGPAATTDGTKQRAAFLDISFTVLASPPNNFSALSEFYSNIKVLPNPLASQIAAADDHLPDPNNPIPTVGPEIPTNSGSFAETDGADNDSEPQILEPFQIPTTDSENWNQYR